MKKISSILDKISEFLAVRKGLLPISGLVLVILNLLIKIIVPDAWLSSTDLSLHLGVSLAILGFMLAWAL